MDTNSNNQTTPYDQSLGESGKENRKNLETHQLLY